MIVVNQLNSSSWMSMKRKIWPHFPIASPIPVKDTKLAFRDKLKFIIPNLKSKTDYTGKTCLKHHSTLCKVCPLLRKAKAYKVQEIKQQLQRRHKNNPFIRDNDPKNSVDDPFFHVGDPTNTASDNINDINNSAQLIKENLTHSIKDTQSGSQLPTDTDLLAKFDFSLCTNCRNCYCPRGTRRRKRKRKRSKKSSTSAQKIPSLLDLPFIIPPHNTDNLIWLPLASPILLGPHLQDLSPYPHPHLWYQLRCQLQHPYRPLGQYLFQPPPHPSSPGSSTRPCSCTCSCSSPGAPSSTCTSSGAWPCSRPSACSCPSSCTGSCACS